MQTPSPLEIVPLCEPYRTQAAVEQMTSCLESGWISSSGGAVRRVEDLLATFTGSQQSVAVVNGTSALHLALLALDLPEDSEVLVPSLTFAASANPILYNRAIPVFVDCSADSFDADIEAIEVFLQKECTETESGLVNSTSGRAVVGIIAVHLYGNVLPISRYLELAKRYSLFLIEDAAEAFGAKTRTGTHPGVHGDLGILSFNGNKLVTAGQGGAVLTQSHEIATKVLHLSTQAKADPIRYSHDAIGYNYRMASLNAALLISQIELLEEILIKKKYIADYYREQFEPLGVKFFNSNEGQSSHWMNPILLPADKVDSWEQVYNALRAQNIHTRPLWQPLHQQPMYSKFQHVGGTNSAELFRYGLCLPSSAGISEGALTRVVQAIKQAFK